MPKTEGNWDECVAIWRHLAEQENIRPALQGVLSLHIKTIELFTQQEIKDADDSNTVPTPIPTVNPNQKKKKTPKDISGPPNITNGPHNYYAMVSVRQFAKTTRVSKLKMSKLDFDSHLHFPVLVPRTLRHPHNYIKIELRRFLLEEINDHEITGYISFHLHDVVQASPVIKHLYLWDENYRIGTIDIEMAFCYGAYGYGHSAQMKGPGHTPHDMIQFSSFPRILPEYYYQDESDIFVNTRPVPHPDFIPFNERTMFPGAKDVQPILPLLEQTVYEPSAQLVDSKDIESKREKYFSTNDRVARLLFLTNYLKTSIQHREVVMSTTRKEHNEQVTTEHLEKVFMTPLRTFLDANPNVIIPDNSQSNYNSKGRETDKKVLKTKVMDEQENNDDNESELKQQVRDRDRFFRVANTRPKANKDTLNTKKVAPDNDD